MLMDGWTAERFLELVESERVTTTFLTPAHMIRLLELPEDEWRRHDVTSLRHVIHAGPEDLLLKEHFLADARAALERLAADAHGHRRARRLPRARRGRLQRRRGAAPTARVQAIYRKMRLPNYGVFDEVRYFQPGRARRDHRGRRRHGRPDDLRGHLAARPARCRRGAGRRAR